jgi:hypothetical protein
VAGIAAAAFWTATLLLMAFVVTVPMLLLTVLAVRSRSGEAFRRLPLRQQQMIFLPSIVTPCLWIWAATFGSQVAQPNSYADESSLKAAAGWHYYGIIALVGLQGLLAVVLPFRLHRGRLAGWTCAALQWWIGALVASVAHYAVLGLAIPVI